MYVHASDPCCSGCVVPFVCQKAQQIISVSVEHLHTSNLSQPEQN